MDASNSKDHHKEHHKYRHIPVEIIAGPSAAAPTADRERPRGPSRAKDVAAATVSTPTNGRTAYLRVSEGGRGKEE